MKNKIALITLLIIILNSVFCYADSDYSVQSIDNELSYDVFSILRQEYNYDEKTDTYYFPTNDDFSLSNVNARGASAVAVKGSVISAVLALAVKAGLEFVTSNSLSEFVGRFFMLDGISAVADGIESVVKKSVDGTLNFSRSLLDSIGSKFAEVMSQKDVTSVYLQGRRCQVIPYTGSSVSDTMARYLFESSSLPKIGFDLGEMTENYQYYDSDIFLPLSSVSGTFSVRARKYRSGTPYTDDVQIMAKTSDGAYETVSSSGTFVEFPVNTFLDGYKAYAVPFLSYYHLSSSEQKYYVGFVVAVYSQTTGKLSTIKAKLTSAHIPVGYFGTTSVLPVIGSAWSDGAILDSDGGSGDVSIKVPKDTNVLVNMSPSDISTPTYEIWTPGVTIVPPVIDTGVDSPPVDDVMPPIIDETPSDDTDTDNPGDSVDTDDPNLFNWLKELLDNIIELIKSIIDWLDNFWEYLWEFFKSLLVPDDTYFVDSLSEIIDLISEKIPSVDIYKLRDLAVGETKFEDIYANFFGIKCLVVKGSIINEIVPWIRAIAQGVVGLFLLLYNYNQIYQLIRGGALYGNNYIKISSRE